MSGLALGLMSGTSVDGVDAALIEVRENGTVTPALRLVAFRFEPFEAALRERILALCEPGATVLEAGAMHVALGRRFGHVARTLLEEAGVAPARVRVVGSHGQTIAHLPFGVEGHRAAPFTLQIGDPASIAEATGVPVVSDFRAHDLALGGEGAPLVPYFDHALFAHAGESRVLLNLGGIANLTVLAAGAPAAATVAFDTGPANMVLDEAAARLSGGRLAMDRDGAWAAAGTVEADLLARWLEHPYFARPWPKSTGREEFGRAYSAARVAEAERAGARAEDILATLTALVAESVARAAVAAVPGPFALIASGGGVHNRSLMAALEARLPLLRPWQGSDAYGVPTDAKEAMAFAYLAWQFCEGRPTNLPSVTGARAAVPLGVWTPAAGRPWPGSVDLGRRAPGVAAPARDDL